ncbi:MAG: hypothetical protein RBS22_02360, partial [Spongiibacteraceae bacterium]|nr:hypothetical protein [Spongiibacteraceae bacterium]
GMEQTAAGIFGQEAAQSRSLRARNTAWFYLGRQAYRRADRARARDYFSRIEGELDADLLPEYQALNLLLMVHDQRLAEASAGSAAVSADSPWAPYVQFNLGVAYLRAGDTAAGLAALAQLDALPLVAADHLALRDRARTAAGYALMEQGAHEQALAQFRGVRQHSAMVHRALLGYGWAFAEQGEFARAIGAWQVLTAYPVAHRDVQEALLAIPYAHEELGQSGAALKALESADARYQQALDQLAQLRAAIDSGQPLVAQGLLASASPQLPSLKRFLEDPLASSEPDRPAPSALPLLRAGESLSLLGVASDDRYLAGLQALEDLQALRERLADWRGRIALYQAMLVARAERRVAHFDDIRAEDFPAQLAAIKTRRDALASLLADAEAGRETMAMVDDVLAAHWARAERAQGNLQRLQAAGHNVEEQADRLRLYRGLLRWRASDQLPAWRWALRRQLTSLDEALARADTGWLRVETAMDTVPDIAPYQQRLGGLLVRLEANEAAIDQRYAALDGALRGMLKTELAAQRQRLRQYQAQARLGVARLYDSLHSEAGL